MDPVRFINANIGLFCSCPECINWWLSLIHDQKLAEPKVSIKKVHRGVRSGNTLRAFKSRYSRRYHSQACIVSRARPALLQKLLATGEGGGLETAGASAFLANAGHEQTTHISDESASSSSIFALNVPLSLNKRSRWLLPPALIRQIDSNDIAQPDLTVSLLERHKLHRRESCVSFHCSDKCEMQRIKPRGGRYFGFSFPANGRRSRRARRRESKEELLRERRKVDIGPARTQGKVVEVFTELGSAWRNLNMDLGETEIIIMTFKNHGADVHVFWVRYEVFYPAPAQCSISHNPKYIKQNMPGAVENSGERDLPGWPTRHPGRAKPQKRKRSRTLLKDIDADSEMPIAASAYRYYVARYDCDQVLNPSLYDDVSIDDAYGTVDDGDDESEEWLGYSRCRNTAVDCLLSSLIEKAERLQRLTTVDAKSRYSRGMKKKTDGHHQDDNSHIVYLPRGEETQVDDDEDCPSPSSVPSITPTELPSRDFTRVLLPHDEVTVACLKDRFGQSYFEAACTPRKFVLDVTANIRELLKKHGVRTKVAEATDEAVSYVIFIHDGFRYDVEYDAYKILLNSRLLPGLVSVPVNTSDQHHLYRGTVSNLINRTMDFADGLVARLEEQNHFSGYVDSITNKKTVDRHLKHHLGTAEAYIPSVQRIFQLGSRISDITIPLLSDILLEEPAFCDVCYDDVSLLTQDSAAATVLLKCKHRVCDTCWARHIHSRLAQGFVRVTCPGFDCQVDVKVGVLLSVVDVNIVEKVLQRQEEVRVSASPTEKWCPDPACGRVIRLQSAPETLTTGDPICHLQQDVVCACGAYLCFRCLSPAHWPASCAQVEDHRNKLSASALSPCQEAKPQDDSLLQARESTLKGHQDKENTLVMEGKHCPDCKRFVYKNGSCPQMICWCGHRFCWYCNIPGDSHETRGPECINEQAERQLSTTVVVRHLEGCYEKMEKKERRHQKSSAARLRRVSLRKRAVEHHHWRLKPVKSKAIANITSAVGTAVAKDKTLAKYITDVCSGTFPSSFCSPSTQATGAKGTTRIAASTCTDSFPCSSPSPYPIRDKTTSLAVTGAGNPGSATTFFLPPFLDTTTDISTATFLPESSHQRSVESNFRSMVTSFLKRAAQSKQELHEVTEYSFVLLKHIPDSLLRRRALHISEDLGAFCAFTQSVFDAWDGAAGPRRGHPREAVKAVVRLAEIQCWINSALASQVTTIKKLRR